MGDVDMIVNDKRVVVNLDRRGIATHQLLLLLIAIAVLVLLFFPVKTLGDFGGLIDLFPDFNESADNFDEDSIIRYSILDDRVEYLKKNEWRPVGDKVKISGVEISGEELRKNFAEDYYFNEAARNAVSIEINSAKLYSLLVFEYRPRIPLRAVPSKIVRNDQFGRISVRADLFSKNNPDDSKIYGHIFVDGENNMHLWVENPRFVIDEYGASEGEYVKNPSTWNDNERISLISSVEAWKESILEKPVTIRFFAGGKSNPQSYRVERIKDYLVVDLKDEL